MFSLSSRKLAAFRIGLGLVLLYDLVDRASAFDLHFASGGVYPTRGADPSLLHLSDASFFQGSIFALAIAAAVALTFGYRTRVAAALAWFSVLNIQAYASLSHFSADDVLRLLLLWGLFLPLGAAWSIDSRVRAETVDSLASAALLAQVAVITFASGLHKIFDPTWAEGRGVELALRAHGTALGRVVAESPITALSLNYLSMVVQIAGPILLFVSSRARTVGVIALIGFQIALALCMRLSFFPFITIVGLALFLPDREGSFRWRPSRRALAAAGVVGVLIPALSLTGNETLTNVVRFAGLGQNWSMFAPPPTHLPWLVVKLEAANGVEIDAATHLAFQGWDAAKELHVPAGIRWATLAFRVSDAPDIAARIGHSICRAWRAGVPEVPVQSSEVYLVVKDLRVSNPPLEPRLLTQIACE